MKQFFEKYNNGAGIRQLNGVRITGQQNQHLKMTLSDGVEITEMHCHIHWVYSENEDENECGTLACPKYSGVFNATLMVDVNGEKKGPNILGNDIYFLWLFTNGFHTFPLDDKYTVNYVSDYRYFWEKAHSKEKCNKNNSGVTCSSWFLSNFKYEE